jgi:predicted acetyltransferase
MPELIAATTRLRESWLAARNEWGPGVHQAGSGLDADDDVDSADGFARWVTRLHREADPAIPPGAGRVRATYWWIVEGDSYLGAITLRHALNSLLLEAGGHIGYSVRPSERRRGVATWALRSVLPEARILGLERVLVTCDSTNLASARTIENAGGVLEDVRDTELGLMRRYWITL